MNERQIIDTIAALAADSGPSARNLARVIDTHVAQPLLRQPPGRYHADLADGQIQWIPNSSSVSTALKE